MRKFLFPAPKAPAERHVYRNRSQKSTSSVGAALRTKPGKKSAVKIPNLRRWLSGFILIVLLLVIGGFIFSSREPEYAGKPVSFWFKEYCRSGQFINWDAARHAESTAALKALGTNAVPYLLAQSFNLRPDSAGWSNICNFLNHLPATWITPRPVSSGRMRAEAPFVLKEIKPPADQLLASMASRLKSTNRMEHLQFLVILGTTGDGAEQMTPYLAAALKDRDVWARRLAIRSLAWIGPKGEAAVPALVEMVEQERHADTNYLARTAAMALGKIGGSNAAPAVPAVKEMFEQETNWNQRCSLAAALFQINHSQTEALDFLIEGVTNHQPASERWIAAMQLGELGPSARAAVPVLLRELAGTNDMLFSQIPPALKHMGIPTETYLPIMKSRLTSNNETTRANAAARILDINPADHDAHLALMKIIQQGTLFEAYAIEILGDAGPAAAEALPALRDVANHESGRNGVAALKAIKQIESKGQPKN
jgi:HEAT repeat protein